MNKNMSMRLVGVLLLGMMLASACTQTYSQAPLSTPTLISTSLFVSPFPSGQDPLKVIEDLGTQTAMASVAMTAGTTTVETPVTPIGTLTPGTAQAGETTSPTSGSLTLVATTPAPATVMPGNNLTPTTAVTPVPVGSIPSTYTLQKGEWPYCIARRFNVNPDELLSANSLTRAQSTALMPGLTLTIPQTGDPFPADRAWHTHPDTYTVSSSDETLYSVACYYGDVYPESIAQANGLSLSTILSYGQQLSIT